jgi:hypothetical protein
VKSGAVVVVKRAIEQEFLFWEKGGRLSKPARPALLLQIGALRRDA